MPSQPDRLPSTPSDDVSPRALSARLRDAATPVTLLDVREPEEWALVHLPHARLVPLDALPGAVDSLDPSEELVVYCHHGARSATAVTWLRARGFAHVHNLAGGIDRWSLEVDPSLPRY